MDDWKPPFDPPTDEQLAALRAQHGEVYKLTNDEAPSVWVKRPGKTTYKAYQAERSDEASMDVANENLLRGLVVYPTEKAHVAALIERYPGLPDDCAAPILRIVGRTGRASATKS